MTNKKPTTAATPAEHPRPNPVVVVTLTGFRRATQAEVTPDVAARARAWLSRDFRDVSYFASGGKDWALAVEHHFNDTKGWHKGVSAFVRV